MKQLDVEVSTPAKKEIFDIYQNVVFFSSRNSSKRYERAEVKQRIKFKQPKGVSIISYGFKSEQCSDLW